MKKYKLLIILLLVTNPMPIKAENIISYSANLGGLKIAEIIYTVDLKENNWNIKTDIQAAGLVDKFVSFNFKAESKGWLEDGRLKPEKYIGYEKISKEFLKADPKKRVKWAGPDMSVRSSITARHMETWSHGQEVYDLLGIIRDDKDRIKNIVIIGINTFSWTFINRSMEVPKEIPKLILQSPSKKTWEWNLDNTQNSITGSATEFCQVVTQVRNIKDTSLVVRGDTASKWMSLAQCFAGPPEDPPKKGTRFTKEEKNG